MSRFRKFLMQSMIVQEFGDIDSKSAWELTWFIYNLEENPLMDLHRWYGIFKRVNRLKGIVIT